MKPHALAWLAPIAGAAVFSLCAAAPLSAQTRDAPDFRNSVGAWAAAPRTQMGPSGPPTKPDLGGRDDMQGQQPRQQDAQQEEEEEDENDDQAGAQDDQPETQDDERRSADRRGPREEWNRQGDRDGSSDRFRRSDDRDSTRDWRRDGAMGPRARGLVGGGFCGRLAERFATSRLAGLERLIQPNEAQSSALDKLREAMTQAQDKISAGCMQQRALTPTARLAALEKRLEVSLDAVKTVRPALDGLYALLSDEQKAQLMTLPRGNFHDRSFRRRDDDANDRHERGRSGAETPDGDRRDRWNDRGDAQRRFNDESDRRSWRRTPDADRESGPRAPMRRDDDRDGWPDRWRGPS